MVTETSEFQIANKVMRSFSPGKILNKNDVKNRCRDAGQPLQMDAIERAIELLAKGGIIVPDGQRKSWTGFEQAYKLAEKGKT